MVSICEASHGTVLRVPGFLASPVPCDVGRLVESPYMRDVSASTLPVRGTCFGCFAPEGRGFDWTPEGGLPPELVQDVMTDGAVAARPKRGRAAVCVIALPPTGEPGAMQCGIGVRVPRMKRSC